MEAVRLYVEPQLKRPSLIAAWPGMGGVAIIAAEYLRDKLGAEEFGEIEPYDFFDLSAVSIRDHVVEEPQFPVSKFYFWQGEGKELIIFIGEAQPLTKGYRLANLILDVAQRLNAKMVYTFAAAPSHVHHSKRPRILGATTHARLMGTLSRNDVTPMDVGSISGMNGLLLGVAKERNMRGGCLLGEIPVYTTHIPNPKSSRAVLEVLTKILGIEIDFSDLDSWAKETEEEIAKNIAFLRETHGEEAKRLLDYFDQLKEQAEVQEPLEMSTEELLREVERFLKGERRKEG